MNEAKYIESLSKIGLNAPESRVYLALIELKESKTGELSKKSNVATSKIYNVLENLIEKGFVGYRLQNNQKVFFASSPQIIKDLLEKKKKEQEEEKKELLALIEDLSKKESESSPYSNYKYYEGIAGIRGLWVELTEYLKNIPKGDEVLVYTGIKEAYELMLGTYEVFHKERAKRGIKYRIIYPMEEDDLVKRRRKQLSEVRFMNLKNEAEWAIVGDKLIIQYITRKVPRSFVIEDEVFVQTFKQVFDQLWKVAKK
jgi:sugar-specific transcriptional regulator TrmB